MISLYEAVCAQSNNYVAHSVSKQIDEKQLMYCIENHCKNTFYMFKFNISLNKLFFPRLKWSTKKRLL